VKHPAQIVRTILLTEKGTRLTESHNQYLFHVHARANKLEIRAAVEKNFGVKVLRVNTLRRQGKLKRLRTMHYGRTPETKRAIVTLKPGDSINLT
jgi:large subunit ribosomal protein L23